MKSLEDALVDAFIVPAKRERYKGHLADRRRRLEILDGLNHCDDFDPRYASSVPSKTDVVALLRSRGAPDSCHVISDARELDGREMLLQEAIPNPSALIATGPRIGVTSVEQGSAPVACGHEDDGVDREGDPEDVGQFSSRR